MLLVCNYLVCLTTYSHTMVPLVHFTRKNLCHFTSGLLLLKYIIFSKRIVFFSFIFVILKIIYFFLIINLSIQAVCACIYRDPVGGNPLEIVQLEEVNGVWSTRGPKRWEGCYYVYEVSVYHPSTLRIDKCHVNDPYARGYAGCLN